MADLVHDAFPPPFAAVRVATDAFGAWLGRLPLEPVDAPVRADDTFVLVGEGYMPAQQAHVELGPEAGWWRWDDGVALPHWRLPASGLRRWAER